MRILKLLSFAMFLASGSVLAQSTYGIGSTPTEELLSAWDIDIGPNGEGLPAGRGTAKEGEQLFVSKGCVGCHGTNLRNGLAPKLAVDLEQQVNDPWDRGKILPYRSPYAPTVWDYINRGMPLGREGTLTANEVYSLVAFLFYKNGVIAENDVMDARSLPKVQMPNRDGWAPLPDWKPGMQRLEGYPY
jgi:cytochrome c